MMRHLLLSAVAVASADLSTNATFGALGDRVTWTRDTQHRWSNKASYAWPDKRLRHFAPAEAMDLLRGRHVLVMGNSVARHVVVALHFLILGRAPDAHGVEIGGLALLEAEHKIWPPHGAGSAELTPKTRKKVVSDTCHRSAVSRGGPSFCPSWLLGCPGTGQKNLDPTAVNCCVARRKASTASMLLTYVFTGTPGEKAIRGALDRWAGTANCAGASAPDFVVLCLTGPALNATKRFQKKHRNLVAFRALAKKCAALRTRHPRTTFILVTPPHKKGDVLSALRAFDLAAVEAARPFDGVVALPLGEYTAQGVAAGALRHEARNSYHYHDAGKLFQLEMLLNAFSMAASRRP